MSEKVSTFARSVMKLRYAHSSAVPMIDGLEKSERYAVLVIGWLTLGEALIIACFLPCPSTQLTMQKKREKCRKESLLMALSFRHFDD